jgi:hypoxanthine phosphoribosyltransferase
MRLSATVLVSEEEIKARIEELAAAINRDFEGKRPVIVSVLNGAYIFAADLTRRLNIKCTLDFVNVKSTEGAETGRVSAARLFLDTNIQGRDVLILDDIYDSGETLSFLIERLRESGPASIRTAVFIKKDHNRPKKDVRIDYAGFTLPDRWLVGYGMDYNGDYRGLPYIGFVENAIAAFEE